MNPERLKEIREEADRLSSWVSSGEFLREVLGEHFNETVLVRYQQAVDHAAEGLARLEAELEKEHTRICSVAKRHYEETGEILTEVEGHRVSSRVTKEVDVDRLCKDFPVPPEALTVVKTKLPKEIKSLLRGYESIKSVSFSIKG